MLSTSFPRFGGDFYGNFVYRMAVELRARGHLLEVLAPHEEGCIRSEHLGGIKVTRFRYMLPSRFQRLAYRGGIPSNIATSFLARAQIPFFLLGFVLASVKPVRRCQVIHCNWTICGFVALIAKWCGNQVIVLSVRGSDMHGSGTFARALNRFVYRRMDRLIAVSNDIAESLIKAGVNENHIRVVPNGVDDQFRPRNRSICRRALALPADRFIVLFVGMLAPVKGLKYLLEAARLIEEKRFLLVLVGEGPLRPELERVVKNDNLGEKILLAGRRPHGEMVSWINAANVLVLPSVSEGRPNVVIEAQACGVPVVATDVGGTSELIADEESGILLNSGDVESLSMALHGLMSNEQRCRKLGDGGRQSLLEKGLTWRACATKVEEVYKEVLRN